MAPLNIVWTKVTEPGACIEAFTAPIPESIQRRIERALQLGTAATNTTDSGYTDNSVSLPSDKDVS